MRPRDSHPSVGWKFCSLVQSVTAAMLIIQCSKDIEESFISLSFIGLLSLHLEVIALCFAACSIESAIRQCRLEGF